MTEKQTFRFPTREAVPPVEHRVANSLEYIAHYLDRIEGHLEQLVKVVDANGAGFPMLKVELSELRKAVEEGARSIAIAS